MMWVLVQNKIMIENPNEAVGEFCKKLTIPNPDFYKKEKMGKWTGGTPRDIKLFEEVSGCLILPYGCINGVMARKDADTVFDLDFKPIRAFNYQSHINLYPYQEKALNEAYTRSHGVIVMPCGAGKTQTGLALASKIGGRTLWLTHTQDLLNQSMNRAKALFDCHNSTYGTITDGRVNIGTGITFATVQTMAKLELSNYKYAFDCVIVDECHKAVGSPTKVMQFYKVLSALSCRYKYGLTATPKRADGLEISMFALLGGICAEVSKEAVADTTCPIKVQMVQTDYFPSMDIVLAGDGTLNYARLVDDLTHDDERFKLILEHIPQGKGAVIVLGCRVEYLQRLSEAYNGRSLCLSGTGNSKAAKEERKEALRKLNAGELDCIYCTYQLAAEGLDIPNLRYVVLATPEKDDTRIKQTCGRVERRAEGKVYGTVIDFEDSFGMYHGWAKKRKALYKKLGYDII